ncbi:hypothetical protein KP509_39G036200 [Ceratopteris richardii]|uniref:ABC transporter domain-containing protein n=1 Tax=Ceratopteris richardii TaxID=49495 RepID=A0A8T2Q0F7_CERRI|nr:hypothetical protein KP509_39G036200 [Ceratopteris richardii]
MGNNNKQPSSGCPYPPINTFHEAAAAVPHTILSVEGSTKNASHLGGLSPLSESLWKISTDTKNLGDVSAWLAWNNLTVKVLNHKGETLTVLDSLTGYAGPGDFTAIMGPSGSGKSTLLDALAGRLASTTMQSGTVKLNGRKRKLCYGAAAYVTQEDNLIGTLTVRETITYSAKLRLPDRMPKYEKLNIIDGVISEMGLQDCADTPIGNWHMRGVSGGEKRRVSIAIEILMRPRLLFLDEPTSGLDSASAFFVTQTLRNLALDGRTVIASIHQPSSEVFELFGKLFLLSGGKTIYFGQASEACNFFASAGFPCPTMRNPSDHFLRCINSDFDRVHATLKSSFRIREHEAVDPLDRFSTGQVINILLDAYQTSEYALQAAAKVHEITQVKGTILESSGSQASFFMQAYTLTKRSYINMFRDVGYYWLRLVIYILVSLCVGTIYYKVGTGYNAILARGSCGAFIFGFVTFMSIGGFPSFVEDMKVFQRERLNGHYGVVAFVIGNSLSSSPFLLLISVISSAICYFMVGLHPGFVHFFYFAMGMYASVMVVEGMMMAIASVVPNFLMGIITGAGIQGMFMLVAGYFRLPQDIPKPVWKYPVSYLSFDFWALQGQYQNDLLGLTFDNGTITGEYLVKEVFQIDMNRSKWVNLFVIFAMVVIYRIVFLLMIKMKENVMPWARGRLARRTLNRRMSTLHSTSKQGPATTSPVRESLPIMIRR